MVVRDVCESLVSAPLAPVAVERVLLQATREVHLLAALTPIDAHKERARLVRAVRKGQTASPRWSYVPVSHDRMRRALDATERELAKSPRTAVDALYLDRARELSVEAALCAAAGTREVARLARERFPAPSPELSNVASDLCTQWLAASLEREGGETLLASDADDPRSLLSRMRSQVGAFRLPFSVLTSPALAPLAATGDRVILIAPGRFLRQRDITRTVLHEIEGHARPRARAATARLAIFRTGTARGIDDQEGRALLLEERATLLDASRKRQLAARHRCVEAMLQGGSFDDVARMLVDSYDVEAEEAVIIAERAFRGGDGRTPGLGRERIYLESLLRVRAHLARRPEDEAILACGQVAVEAIGTLRPYAPI